MLKRCKVCNLDLPITRFYFLGYFRKKGGKAYGSYCRECNSKRIYKKKSDKPYKPHTKVRYSKEDVKEEIFIEVRSIYILLKRIELNQCQVSYIDSFRLLDEYIKVFGNDIPDYYNEEEQLDIMFFKLKEYIKKPCPYELS